MRSGLSSVRLQLRLGRWGSLVSGSHLGCRAADSRRQCFFYFCWESRLLTLGTKRPMVEALPAAGISSSALLLVAFPLSFAVRLHGMGAIGPKLLLFALVITWAGDTSRTLWGERSGSIHLRRFSARRRLGKARSGGFVGSLLVGVAFSKWTGCRWGRCWRWRRWVTWRGKLAICWSRPTSAVRA